VNRKRKFQPKTKLLLRGIPANRASALVNDLLAMRTFLFIALSITLSVPVFGQDVSLHGVSLGDSFPEAITRLKDRGIDVRSESDDFGYYIRCRVDNRTVTVSASKSDFESLEAANAQEITSSLSVVDVSSQEVVETYNKYKKLWSEELGQTSPTKRGAIYYWSWETDRIEANITYTERGMNPHSVDLTLARP
jgi:hypothetical protein